MNRIAVKSSQIASVGHDPATQTLEIQFINGPTGARRPGSVYQYAPVTKEQHAAFVGAESVGGHFGKHFKTNPGLTVTKTHDAGGVELPQPLTVQKAVA